jgi:hypothetical protein
MNLADQLLFVSTSAKAIKTIFNPCLAVQLKSVESFPSSIEFIPNPCREVQLTAVRKDPYVINKILDYDEGECPLLEAQLEAVKKDGKAIQDIDNPCLEVQLQAVRQCHGALAYIPRASIEVQIASLRANIWSLEFVYDIQAVEQADLDYNICYLDDHSSLLFLSRVPKIIYYLLNLGIDPDIRDDQGLTASFYPCRANIIAKWKGCKKILPFLRKCKWYRLAKLVKSKMFCEWYYASNNTGGIRARRSLILYIASSLPQI